jgi:FKBP-type peptidyl-prolyl cis-trans isomerase FkpA
MFERSITAFALVLGALACASPSPPPEDELPRAGPGVLYAIGASLGGAVAVYELDESEAREVARGLVDAARHEPHAAPLTPETQELMTAFDEQRRKVLARREEQAGAPLLEAAAREPGAVKTESGMVLRVIEPGAGPSPTIFDFVRVNYHGTLRDGRVFESNRGQEPSLVQLGRMTRCWQEALGAVAAGARVHAVCPPSLGYDWVGTPSGNVPGGGVLIFDFELLAVEECSTHGKVCSLEAK